MRTDTNTISIRTSLLQLFKKLQSIISRNPIEAPCLLNIQISRTTCAFNISGLGVTIEDYLCLGEILSKLDLEIIAFCHPDWHPELDWAPTAWTKINIITNEKGIITSAICLLDNGRILVFPSPGHEIMIINQENDGY